MKHLVRASPRGGIKVRSAGDGSLGQFDALVLNYNVVDDYNTTFKPGVFTKSLKARLPRVCWSHDWSEPIGQVVGYEDTDKGLTVSCQLDAFDAVPMARRAWVQMESGTIDQFSVGFWMQGYNMPKDDKGPMEITKGQLDEISPVLVGAVPKTKLLAVRSRLLRIATPDGEEAMISVGAAAEIIAQLGVGDLDLAEALIAIKQASILAPASSLGGLGDGNEGDDPPGPKLDADGNPVVEKTDEELEAERLAAEQAAADAEAARLLEEQTIDALISEGLAVVGR